jgi:hypothetical protein
MLTGRFGRTAVADRREHGMDSTAGSGHRPTVAVGTPIYSWANRAVWVSSGRTRAGTDIAGAGPQPFLWQEGHKVAAAPSAASIGPTHPMTDRSFATGARCPLQPVRSIAVPTATKSPHPVPSIMAGIPLAPLAIDQHRAHGQPKR